MKRFKFFRYLNTNDNDILSKFHFLVENKDFYIEKLYFASLFFCFPFIYFRNKQNL